MQKMSISSAVLLPLVLSGCHGAILGNLFVLGITVGIFVATLSLGRVAPQKSAQRNAETSTSSSQS